MIGSKNSGLTFGTHSYQVKLYRQNPSAFYNHALIIFLTSRKCEIEGDFSIILASFFTSVDLANFLNPSSSVTKFSSSC